MFTCVLLCCWAPFICWERMWLPDGRWPCQLRAHSMDALNIVLEPHPRASLSWWDRRGRLGLSIGRLVRPESPADENYPFVYNTQRTPTSYHLDCQHIIGGKMIIWWECAWQAWAGPSASSCMVATCLWKAVRFGWLVGVHEDNSSWMPSSFGIPLPFTLLECLFEGIFHKSLSCFQWLDKYLQ